MLLRSGAWLSLVERELWELDVAGSNPAAPIVLSPAQDLRCE